MIEGNGRYPLEHRSQNDNMERSVAPDDGMGRCHEEPVWAAWIRTLRL